jgi:hypothetical protein
METITEIQKPILALKVEARKEGLLIVTDNGQELIEWNKCSIKLANATHEERTQLELSPSGYGIHWRLIDEDLSVGRLIRQASKS